MDPGPPLASPSDQSSELPFDCTLLEQFPTIVWIDDVRGHCVYLNRYALDFTGRSMDEERGLGWHSTLHPVDLENYLASFQLAVELRRPFEAEFRLLRHDGDFRWMFERASPLHDQHG